MVQTACQPPAFKLSRLFAIAWSWWSRAAGAKSSGRNYRHPVRKDWRRTGHAGSGLASWGRWRCVVRA